MKPYYDDGTVTIYHGDCRELLPALSADLLLTDPPYGISERTARFSAGRSGPKSRCNEFAPVHGDDAPFDPEPLLTFERLVLFGANHYADRLPPSSSWIVWDKLDGLLSPTRDVGFNDNSDVELAWSNLGGPARVLRHRWMGALKASEGTERRIHPTQKPVALMAQIIAWRTEPGHMVLDPYMGSGSTIRAAKDLGRRAVGIEVEERYCEIAARRMGQEVLDLGDAA